MIIRFCLASLLALQTVLARDFYKMLGLKRNCKESEIKKAYHKAALTWHPDKQPPEAKEKASQRFAEIATAYEVLSDPEKRKLFDQYGEEGLKPGFQPGFSGGGPGGPGGQHGFPGGFGGGFPGGQQQQGGNSQFHFSSNFGGAGGQGGAGGFQFGGQDPFDIFSQFFGQQGGGAGGGFEGFGKQPQQRQPARESADLYDAKSPVTKLSQTKFPKASSRHVWLIEMYAPWCGHCQALVPGYEQLARELAGVVKVGAVNCEIEKELCSAHGVQSYPTVKAFVAGTEVPYSGESNAVKPLREFALAQLPEGHAVNLRRPDTVQEFLSEKCSKAGGSESGVCAILFTDKYETSPTVKALAFAYKDRIALGEVRGSNANVESIFGITQHPTLLFICGGDKSVTFKYEGQFKAEALQKYMSSLNTSSSKQCKAARAARKESEQRIAQLKPAEVPKMRIGEIRDMLHQLGSECVGCAEKSDYVAALQTAIARRA